MTENFNQPRNWDVVLGGGIPTSLGKAVLGGIAGVKWRLGMGELPNHPYSIEQKIAALSDALSYGNAGLDLLIQALENESWHVHQAACNLLEKHAATKAEAALKKYKSRLAKELLKLCDAGERNFHRANLSEIYLPWADLSEINLSEANLSRAYLNRAYLSGADLNQANLSEVNLIDADLSQANLNRTNLNGAYLNKVNLSGANLKEANLRKANLCGANLSEANLSEVKLSWVNLSEANLSGANLSGTNLAGTNLTNSNLARANLSSAKLNGTNLSDTNLIGAYYDDETAFPVGFSAYSQIIKLPTSKTIRFSKDVLPERLYE